MRIPDGTNFGNAVAQPSNAPTYSAGDFGAQQAQANAQLGQAASGLANELGIQNQQLQRTAAMGAYQDHITNVKTAQQQANQGLAQGTLSPDDYHATIAKATQQSFDSTVGALPDSQYKAAAQVQTTKLNRAVALSGDATLYKYNQNQMVAQNDALLDKTAKTIAVDPGSIDASVQTAKAGYLATAQGAGIPAATAQQKFSAWSDQQYAQNANFRALQARESGDINALNALEKDLTDPNGFYAGKIGGAARNQVLSSVISQRSSLENQADAAQSARENAASDIYNQGLKMTESGHLISPQFTQDILNATKGTSVAEQAQQMIQANASGARFAGQSIANMRASLNQDQSAANTQGSDPATQAAIQSRQKMLDSAIEDYKKNPWQAALDRGVLTSISPIDASSVQGALSSLNNRMAQIGIVDDRAGRKVSPLEPQEAQQLQQMLSPLSPEAKGQYLQNLGSIIRDPQRIADLSAQWKDKDPVMALAMKTGAMGANGGPLMTNNGVPVSTFILAGEQAKKDGIVKVDETADAGLKSTIARAIDGALPPDQAADAKQAAYYMAMGNAARNARTSLSKDDAQIAIDTATGGLSDTGGTPLSGHISAYRVARPYGWTDNQFQTGVKSAGVGNIENQVDGKPVTTVYANGTAIPSDQFMQKFPSYRLMRVGIGGSYAVYAGQSFVTDSTGKPVTIRLNQSPRN